MYSFAMGDKRFFIVLIPTAEFRTIRVQYLVINTFVGNTDFIVPIKIRGHVEDADNAFRCAFAFEDIDALVSVIGHDPREVEWIVFFQIESIVCPIDTVKLANEVLNPLMLGILKNIKGDGLPLFPLIERSDFIAHEIKFLAGMGKLHSGEACECTISRTFSSFRTK